MQPAKLPTTHFNFESELAELEGIEFDSTLC